MCEKDFICETFTTGEKESGVETVPCIIMEVETIQEQRVTGRIFVLFDPGSNHSYIKESIQPKSLTPNIHNQVQRAITLRGETQVAIAQ